MIIVNFPEESGGDFDDSMYFGPTGEETQTETTATASTEISFTDKGEMRADPEDHIHDRSSVVLIIRDGDSMFVDENEIR